MLGAPGNGAPMRRSSPVGIVIATCNRRRELLATLQRVSSLAERPPIVVVDNGSDDGTPEAMRERFPAARVVAHPVSRGAAARTDGAALLGTPLVAFCDDDSWWAPGALTRAADHFERHPRLGLLAARVLVGPEERLDPTCAAMAASPLPRCADLPGPSVLGFVACGAIVRRSAFLEAGGFEGRYGFGGEEEQLAIDLRTAGWGLAYTDDVVAHHQPATDGGARPGRTRRQQRNALWSAWRRRPAPAALRLTAAVASTSPKAAVDAFAGARWALRGRRVVPPEVERELRLLAR